MSSIYFDVKASNEPVARVEIRHAIERTYGYVVECRGRAPLRGSFRSERDDPMLLCALALVDYHKMLADKASREKVNLGIPPANL